MTLRRLLAALSLAILGTPGAATAANYTTTNFVVTAPDEQLARKFGEMAEFYRKEKALEWLGQEMPNWPQRCPLRVVIAPAGAGGATTFGFDRGGVSSQQMDIKGPARQLLNSVLPHEITHTVLAHHFGRPVPRWADEGGSVLSENDEERTSHDIRCREILNQGKAFRLSVLFRMVDYPRDMIVLYAEGYSVSAYLVERGGGGQAGRRKLLQFLAYGMEGSTQNSHGTPTSWNAAAQRVYGAASVDALEGEWIEALKYPGARVAARNTANPGSTTAGISTQLKGTEYAATAGARAEVRSSAAPALPILEPPVRAARGTAPDFEPVRGATRPVGTTAPAARPDIPDRPPPVLLPPEIPRPLR
jgi:hypothetical protein